MSRFLAIAVAVLALCLAGYTIGLTVGYSGCVAGASELFTNKMMRGM